MRYDPSTIEAKWQKRWLKERTYEPDMRWAKRPFYNLMMFPYPSAEGLHIGSVRTFTGVDIYGRFKRMQGHDVFEPIGLDGFGIHSENYALKIGKHPAEQAKVSEKNFYRQLGAIGNGFSWEERLETYDPAYYKWTQWIFVQMFKRGLAYRKKATVNWCPSCLTVLADEQVISGECERCGTKVVKKELEQWFFKITAYAERLLKNLEKIDWAEKIKIAQRNWIGRSEGALLNFPILNSKFQIGVFTTRPDTLFGATYMVLAPEHQLVQKLKSRTKNWKQVERYFHAAAHKSEAERLAEGRVKTGVKLEGVLAVNPANREKIPVWVADYVLGHVGTGAIMAVPAHDERDFEFAKKFNLPIRTVIEPIYTQNVDPGKVVEGLPFDHRDAIIAVVKHWSKEKYLALKWKKVAWGTFITGGIEKGQTAAEAAKVEICEETGYLSLKLVADFGVIHSRFYHVPKKVNRFAHSRVLLFKLQNDKQEPISAKEEEIHDIIWLTKEELKNFLTPDSHLRVLEILNGDEVYNGYGVLVDSGKFSGMNSEKAKWEITRFVGGKKKIQYRLRDWLISRQRYWGPPIPLVFCENCKKRVENSKSQVPNSKKRVEYSKGELENPGWIAVPEKDLPIKLPYIKNFRPTGTGVSPLGAVKSFYQVRCPKCKAAARRETDVSDTFLDSAWYFLRYPSVGEKTKPWNPAITKKWLPVHSYIGGAEHAVLHLLYSRFLTMVFHDWELLHFEEPFTTFRAHGLITRGGAKMSKSKGNIVNPDDYLRAYGADAIRMYLAFLAPFEQSGDFQESGIKGITRFLERVWKFFQSRQVFAAKSDTALRALTHYTIKKVTADVEALQYNTAISALMVFLNAFENKAGQVTRKQAAAFLKLLAPFAPHIAEELWPRIGGEKSIHLSPWPKVEARPLQPKTFFLVVQVNGRVRDRIEIRRDISEREVRAYVLGRPKIKKRVSGQPVKKFIYVPGRIANIVI